jgi:hypothetical protein
VVAFAWVETSRRAEQAGLPKHCFEVEMGAELMEEHIYIYKQKRRVQL